MPRYDYDCAACGTRFEVIHGVHADPPTVCPLCGDGPIKKAFAPPTIVFKGSGWAKKERRATAAPGAAKDGTSEDAAPGTSDAKDGAEASPPPTTAASASPTSTTPGAAPSGASSPGPAGAD